jgi:hypothetical protein
VKAARLFVALLVARAAYGLVFLGVSVGRWPVPLYYPLERRWSFEASPDRLAMAWFGGTAAALAAAIALGLAAWALAGRAPIARALAKRRTVLASARAGGLVLLVDFAYFGWTLTHQTPAPLPVECAPDPLTAPR